MNNQELPRRALDLSLAIYRISVSARLPQGEVLVAQMKTLANEIAAELGVMGETEQIKKDIAKLRVYFQIAKAQNWVKEINWSILDFEYYRLEQELALQESARMGELTNKHELEKEEIITSHNIKAGEKRVKRPPRHQVVDNLPLRQDRIMKVVQNKGFVKMADLIPLFKDDVSERTLRNELQDLVQSGLIKKRGERKHTEYYL